MNLLARYNESLKNIVPPGCGCHPYLLSTANYGVLAGLTAEQIFSDIRNAIPQGSRRIPDKEIQDAINKALSDHNGGSFTPKKRPAPVVNDGKTALQKIICQAKITTEVDLFDVSPVKITWEPEEDTINFLSLLFDPGDHIFIGDKFGTTVKPVFDWIDGFRKGAKTSPHIIPNPMTGREGMTKDGKPSYRCDNTVKKYSHCMAEFDDLSRADQIRFWSAARLPVVCLIDSGGKSIHAWLDVQKLATVETPEQWQSAIKQRLYDSLLAPLGVDKACSNPARLSRLPGHYRTEKGNYQRILWLSGLEGRFIA
ncbi:MAG: hypothetical protein NTW12_15445 [Deltaproteobacteria bacterium]|nr:hypothetical protein [Deltaproteobacteria bacterium]